jgi:hypothetical protein
MADSNNTTTLPLVTRRRVVVGVAAARTCPSVNGTVKPKDLRAVHLHPFGQRTGIRHPLLSEPPQ